MRPRPVAGEKMAAEKLDVEPPAAHQLNSATNITSLRQLLIRRREERGEDQSVRGSNGFLDDFGDFARF